MHEYYQQTVEQEKQVTEECVEHDVVGFFLHKGQKLTELSYICSKHF